MIVLRNKSLELQRIGTVTFLNGEWRLTCWRRNGPSGHQCFSTEAALEREIRYDWVDDPAAGDELERWSLTPEWERGLKGCQVISCWNACAFHGRYDLAQELDLAEIGEAVAMIPRIRAALRAL